MTLSEKARELFFKISFREPASEGDRAAVRLIEMAIDAAYDEGRRDGKEREQIKHAIEVSW